jgi:hypothetical protein
VVGRALEKDGPAMFGHVAAAGPFALTQPRSGARRSYVISRDSRGWRSRFPSVISPETLKGERVEVLKRGVEQPGNKGTKPWLLRYFVVETEQNRGRSAFVGLRRDKGVGGKSVQCPMSNVQSRLGTARRGLTRPGSFRVLRAFRG